MKINKKFLWEVIFNFSLLVGGIFYAYRIMFCYTAEEMVQDLQAISSDRIRRSRAIDIIILNSLGKEGYFFFIIIVVSAILKYRFLPSLRKFLGRKVEDEEEGKKSEE